MKPSARNQAITCIVSIFLLAFISCTDTVDNQLATIDSIDAYVDQ